jgi:hypothetical protein
MTVDEYHVTNETRLVCQSVLLPLSQTTLLLRMSLLSDCGPHWFVPLLHDFHSWLVRDPRQLLTSEQP